MPDEGVVTSGPRCIALTQEHRGHGVSTAAYYLGLVLVSQGLRVLLVDLTGRRGRLASLVAKGPAKNLVLWTPPLSRPQDVGPALEQARRQTTGHADVMLLDVDAALLERAGGFALGIDYVIAVTEPTAAGQESADRVAERLHDEQPPHGRVGVVFSRVGGPTASELPEQTEARHLPILGHYPADYLLASGDAYSLKGGDSSWPHDSYLFALLRLGQRLVKLVHLHRPSHTVSTNHAAGDGAVQPTPGPEA
jgi:MinD-like ATPase involved in chromosome partitioning or flagellar assembly